MLHIEGIKESRVNPANDKVNEKRYLQVTRTLISVMARRCPAGGGAGGVGVGFVYDNNDEDDWSRQ